MGYNLDSFSISGKIKHGRFDRHDRHDKNDRRDKNGRHHHDQHNFDHRFRESPFHHKLLHNFYTDHSHPRNISLSSAEYAEQLLNKFDHTVHTEDGIERDLDKQELINAIKDDINIKFKSGDNYNFF